MKAIAVSKKRFVLSTKRTDMADIYREKVIKVRVTDEEYVALKQRSAKPRLAEWMRETCLDTSGQRKSRSQPRSSADPALLRQLAGIGNNLNQIARRVNSGQWGPLERVHVMTALAAVERQLAALKPEHHDR